MPPRRRDPLRRLRTVTCVVALAAIACAGRAASGTPDWVDAALREPVPALPAETKAVTLLDEGVVTYANDGRSTTQRRVVLRVLKPAGADSAIAAASYQQGTERVKSLNAWLVNPGATVRTYGKRDLIDVSVEADQLYSESRRAVLDASSAAVAGSVFAWESVLEEPPFLAQGVWQFATANPVAVARVRLQTPRGVRVEGALLNHEPVLPRSERDAITWELRNLPGAGAETLGPPATRRLVGLRYDLRWDAGTPRPATLSHFQTWQEIARFSLERVGAPDGGTELRAKTAELCRDKPTNWEKVRAIGAYVQNLRYVAITVNLNRGGGFTPHRSDEVFRCGYGDCKDKTTLLRAMLAAAGITTHPVLAYSGDRNLVREDWPSPLQFNHMLAAIEVDETVSSPFVINDPVLGRVLFFDPTDRFVPPGDYPATNQGALVLVSKSGNDRLTRVPVSPAQSNRLHREITGRIRPDGTGLLRLVETATGRAAVRERARNFEQTERKRKAEERLREQAAGAVLHSIEVTDDLATNTVRTTIELSVPGLARKVGQTMLVLRPLVFGKSGWNALGDTPRRQPIILPVTRQDTAVELVLPVGYVATDTAAPIAVEQPFGRFTSRTDVAEGKLNFRAALELDETELPATAVGEWRSFVEQVRRGENSQVVLEAR